MIQQLKALALSPAYRKSGLVIGDYGCGEATIARTFDTDPQLKKGSKVTVHSYDLVAANKYITAADIAALPLSDGVCDVVVFCLSLMGTNWMDFVKEAYRTLKVGSVSSLYYLQSFRWLIVRFFVCCVD